MSEMDINAALGMTYEYGERAPIVPESYYPCILHVVSTGSSDPKMVEVKDAQKNVILDETTGQPLMEEGGNAPFVELSADIYDGPFKGYNVTRRVYITPGRSGKAMGKWLGACHAITGQYAPVMVMCQKFGIALPNPASVRPTGKETADQAYQKAVTSALGEGFHAMDAASRLAFVAALLGVVSWDGKRVIVRIGCEERLAEKEGRPILNADGNQRIYSNNNFDGFIPLAGDKAGKHGLNWVQAVEFPRQAEVKAKMDELAAGTGA